MYLWCGQVKYTHIIESVCVTWLFAVVTTPPDFSLFQLKLITKFPMVCFESIFYTPECVAWPLHAGLSYLLLVCTLIIFSNSFADSWGIFSVSVSFLRFVIYRLKWFNSIAFVSLIFLNISTILSLNLMHKLRGDTFSLRILLLLSPSLLSYINLLRFLLLWFYSITYPIKRFRIHFVRKPLAIYI